MNETLVTDFFFISHNHSPKISFKNEKQVRFMEKLAAKENFMIFFIRILSKKILFISSHSMPLNLSAGIHSPYIASNILCVLKANPISLNNSYIFFLLFPLFFFYGCTLLLSK